jgi:hypothetical protein
MHEQPTSRAGDDAEPERGGPPPRPTPVSVAELHDALARLATTIAAAGGPAPRPSAVLRSRARALLDGEALPAPSGRRDGPAARQDARVAVTTFAEQLRTDGAPPERMLVVLKAAVRDSAPGTLDPHQLHALTEDVVRWSIEAFYAP